MDLLIYWFQYGHNSQVDIWVSKGRFFSVEVVFPPGFYLSGSRGMGRMHPPTSDI